MDKFLIKKWLAPGKYSGAFAALLFALVFLSCFSGKTPAGADGTLPMRFLSGTLQESPSVLSALLSSLFLLVVAFLMVRVNEVHLFIRKRTALPALLFLFFSAFSDFDVRMNAGCVGVFFLVLAVGRYFEIFEHGNVMKSIFDTFFLLSAGSFFHADLLLLSIVFFVAMPFAGNFQIRQFCAALIAFSVPYVLGVPLVLAFGKMEHFLACLRDSLAFRFAPPDAGQIVYMAFFAVTLLGTTAFWAVQNLRNEIRVRRMLLFFFLLTYSVGVLGIFRIGSFASFAPLTVFCLSFVGGYYFTLSLSRSRLTGAVLGVFLLVPVVLSAVRIFGE